MTCFLHVEWLNVVCKDCSRLVIITIAVVLGLFTASVIEIGTDSPTDEGRPRSTRIGYGPESELKWGLTLVVKSAFLLVPFWFSDRRGFFHLPIFNVIGLCVFRFITDSARRLEVFVAEWHWCHMAIFGVYIINRAGGLIYQYDHNMPRVEVEKTYGFPLDLTLKTYDGKIVVSFGQKDGVKGNVHF